MRRVVAVVVVIAIFIGGAALGRLVVVPMLQGRAQAAAPSGAQAAMAGQTPFAQCMGEALGRRMDPVEARHTCGVVAASLTP